MKLSVASVERWVWYLFLATAALQTRVIFWHADILFNEWRSASLYFSDICMALLFAFALAGARGNSRLKLGYSELLLGGVIVAAIVSLTQALQLTVGVYQLIRLLQFVAFFYYLRVWAWHRFDAERGSLAFVIGALTQAALGIGQYIAQHDMGLRWFGETLLRTDMRGVAVFYDATGEKILRAYGTLPHPNVLAAYLVVAFWLVVWLWMRHGHREGKQSLPWIIAVGMLLIGQYLTFSRTIIAVWVFSLVSISAAVYLSRISGSWPNSAHIRSRLRAVLLLTGVVTLLFVVILWPKVVARLTISGSDEAVRLRVLYNTEAVSSGLERSLRINWTGVGIGNFTTWLARYDRTLPSYLVQPAHNIYLLVYSEIGLFGLMAWIAWLVVIARMMWRIHGDQPLIRVGLTALFLAMIGVGMLDHFFWTLQQGRIVWWGVMALAAGRT